MCDRWIKDLKDLSYGVFFYEDPKAAKKGKSHDSPPKG